MLDISGWEVLTFAAVPVLLIVALSSIAMSTAASGTEKALWILIALVAPVLGPILWFVVGKRTAQGAVAPRA